MKNMVQWRRRIVLALIAALVGWGLYSGFRAQPVVVDLGAAARAPMRVAIEQEGRTRVVDRYVITAPVAAYARRIALDVGDAVQTGMPVVTLEPQRAEVLDVRRRAEAEARVAGAQANIGAVEQRMKAAQAGAGLALKDLQRVRTLRAAGHVTADAEDRGVAEAERAGSELRSAQFTVATARHELEAARTALGYAAAGGPADPVVLRSPVAGNVLKIPRKSEGAVSAGQALLEIGDPRGLEVEVDVLSADAVRISPGTRVLFERWGGEGALEGVVRVIEPAGFTKVSALGVEEQRVWVIVAFTSPSAQWQRLGDGYRVEASFILWEDKDVLQIPASALFRDGSGWAAFVVEQGKAVKRRIEPGQRNGLIAQALSGIREGEQVIVHPDDRLREGASVTAR
ncbi:efflux RND transporter periplasmic adaptor subunit [Aromatoleum diolicum]|uniref:HlyD family efflux transporter periplasmic adaptor subunit n=1 Tax=Aromatoleum diolicum TaxID=75796 RepID=A0ABX1Q4T2_9RHOO|nr:HlyD family efflux transporter periplasmic adaptor subunit [Aromatoleum diolicum]NMG73369.1 HlyD family efflux transporter periplasmic adaptor subunit [Aromatoleum diolicum]